MINTVIFDLSEVIISGLVGVEKVLANDLKLCTVEEGAVSFRRVLESGILTGALSENDYLAQLISEQGWSISVTDLKTIIRGNFHHEVPGSWEIVRKLRGKYRLVLLSDHAREWVEYILGVHPIADYFQFVFFSFQIGATKKSPEAFQYVLEKVGVEAHECLFVDDSSSNVRLAESLGIASIRFENARQLTDRFREIGLEI